jgi:ubiquinone biosynthesis protein UbiJ
VERGVSDRLELSTRLEQKVALRARLDSRVRQESAAEPAAAIDPAALAELDEDIERLRHQISVLDVEIEELERKIADGA